MILAAALLCFLMPGLTGFGKLASPDPIRLVIQKPVIAPGEFYIRNITDTRPDKQPIAKLVTGSGEHNYSIQAVDLHGGGYKAIRSFMLQSMVQNPSKRPLNIRIRECKITESFTDGRINGRIAVTFEYELIKESGNIPLTQYRASAKYSRSFNSVNIVEPTLRQLLTGSLKFINNWMNREARSNVKLATAVKISFSDFSEQHPDTIYYDRDRPLEWDDFRARPLNSRFVAEVFPSFGYEQSAELTDGIIHVDLALKVYVVKSSSWVLPGSQNSHNLNHEQRHFDLVKLVAEDFKRKLRTEALTVENYEGIINYEYLEFFRAMNKIQEQYDSETSHGVNHSAQQLWNRKIDAELSAIK